MINKTILMGRIVNDLEVKQTPSGVSVLSFTLAVERSFAKQGEDRESDFISCVAWRTQADFIGKYFGKGRMIALEGNLRTRTYEDKNGTKHYITEVYVDNVSFTGEPKNKAEGSSQGNYVAKSETPQKAAQMPLNVSDFEEVISDDGVPF